jgi:polyhydroxybutyrate depolymerase
MDHVVFSNYKMQKPMPLCYIHGTADATVEIEGDESSVGWSEILSLWIDNNATSHNPIITELPDISAYDNSTVTKFENKSYSGKADIIFYRINNGGHSIPGLGYPTNKDINAFEEIWKFFKEYTL